MIQQKEITLRAREKGFHLVTAEILSALGPLPEAGLLHLFVRHTSCGLTLNENADPDVRTDMETIFNRLVPEHQAGLTHTLEGPDDMPAHAKATISGVSLTIPISHHRLMLGTWQGIYLCEYRRHGGNRQLVATIIS